MSDHLQLWRYWQAGTRSFAADDVRTFRAALERLQKHTGGPLAGKRMLDIGCGQHYPETLLYHNEGAHITGVDLDVVSMGPSLGKYIAIARANGLSRAAKSLVRELVFDPVYFAELERQCGRRLGKAGLDLRTADAAHLPFVDQSFDIVVSTNAFEHIADLDGAVREAARVLKPGGLAHVDIHLFTSLSGGHHLEWTWPERAEQRRTPPWDHLRRNSLPVAYYLNRKREREYRACFDRHFKVIDWLRGPREGARYLTPELRAELAGYGEDELLTRNIIVVATTIT